MAVQWNLLMPVKPETLDVGNILADVNKARDANRKEAQYNALVTAGKRMQAGDTKGASGELYAGGLFNEGMGVDEFQRKKAAADRDETARLAFAVKSPDDLARVHSFYTSRGMTVPEPLRDLASAQTFARSWAMSPHETAMTDLRRREVDRAGAESAARLKMAQEEHLWKTPEYKASVFDSAVGPTAATDPRRLGYVYGIGDKPPTTIKLGKDDRLLEPPTPSRPGGYRDVTPERPGGPVVDHETRGDEHKLRQQFLTHSDEYIKVRDAFGRIKASSGDPSAAGDMSMIFSFMKMLDPGSVVREGEYATAQNAAGVPDRVRALFNRMLAGERLAPAQRADFLQQAERIYGEQTARFQQSRSEFARVARESGLDPRRVILDIERPSETPSAAGGATARAGAGAAPAASTRDAPPPVGSTRESLTRDAQAAIARGADPAKVQARLMQDLHAIGAISEPDLIMERVKGMRE